jgi:hypothetical protein
MHVQAGTSKAAEPSGRALDALRPSPPAKLRSISLRIATSLQSAVTIFAGAASRTARASLLRRAQIRGSEDHAGAPQRWLTPARLAIPRRDCYFWRYEITEAKTHRRQTQALAHQHYALARPRNPDLLCERALYEFGKLGF